MTPHRLGPMLRAMTVARRAADMVAEARATIEELTVDELAGELASPNVVLVDLRETDELAVAGSIPQAVHVPRGTLEFQADPASRYHNPALRPERRVILLCATGARSALAAATLARMGYHDVAHLDSGIDAWIESGRPTRRDEDVRQSNQTPPKEGPMMRTRRSATAGRKRISYANVMSTAAFVMAFGGGTAYASHLVVRSDDIVNGEVKAVDLANGSVTSAKIRDGDVATVDLAPDAVTGAQVADGSVSGADVAAGSLTGSDIADGSLAGVDLATGSVSGTDVTDGSITGADIASNSITGTDVNEATLGSVSSAIRASNVNGETVIPIEFLAGPNTAERTILSTGRGLTLRARCDGGGDIEVFARTDRNARLFSWSVDSDAVELDNLVALESFTVPTTVDLVNEDDGDQSGQTTYMTSGGSVVVVNWAADNNTSAAFGTQCTFVGTAAMH